VSTSDLEASANEYFRFTMHFFPLIQQSAPHIYHSALPLSPESSIFRTMSLSQKTQIFGFYGGPDNWGPVLRTIKGTPRGFVCMTIVGHGSTARIAAAGSDGTVYIYGSVTGALRLSLSPPHPTQTITGSLDGSILFCTHRGGPSITLWDIQTGGLVHTFTLATEATDTAVSMNGRYLACGLSDTTVDIWEVANRTAGPALWSGSPITCLCWLAPEERLMVAVGASVYIRDITAGGIVIRSFNMEYQVCGAVYSQRFNLLAVMTTEYYLTFIDTQPGSSLAPYTLRQGLSSFAFSQTTRELVCGLKTRGLALIDISARSWTCFDFPATVTTVSKLSNGTVVANVAGSGIQLLNLDKAYASSQQRIPPALTVHPSTEAKSSLSLRPIATASYFCRRPPCGRSSRFLFTNITRFPPIAMSFFVRRSKARP
jgi:WD40 repeat protein